MTDARADFEEAIHCARLTELLDALAMAAPSAMPETLREVERTGDLSLLDTRGKKIVSARLVMGWRDSDD